MSARSIRKSQPPDFLERLEKAANFCLDELARGLKPGVRANGVKFRPDHHQLTGTVRALRELAELRQRVIEQRAQDLAAMSDADLEAAILAEVAKKSGLTLSLASAPKESSEGSKPQGERSGEKQSPGNVPAVSSNARDVAGSGTG